MKRVIKYLMVLFALLVILPACKDDLLTEKNMNSYPPNLVFVSTNGFDAVLTGTYEQVRYEWSNYLRWGAAYIGTDAAEEGKGSFRFKAL